MASPQTSSWTGGYVSPPADWKKRVAEANKKKQRRLESELDEDTAPPPLDVPPPTEPVWYEASDIAHVSHPPERPATIAECQQTLAAVHAAYLECLRLIAGKPEDMEIVKVQVELISSKLLQLQEQVQTKVGQCLRVQVAMQLQQQIAERKAMLQQIEKERALAMSILEGKDSAAASR